MAYKITAKKNDRFQFVADKQVAVAAVANRQPDTEYDATRLSCRTHDFYQLINVFISEVRRAVPCDGIKYREDRLSLNYIDGVISQHQCNYELISGELPLGKICFSRDREFLDSELAEIEKLLAGLIQPLKRALQYQRAVRYALRDNLTGLRNGSSYYDNITQEIDRARRYRVVFSLLLVNLDNFREINELYGRCAGNSVLVEVARRLENVARSSDIIFRKGGDEFLILLPNTARKAAIKVAERIKSSVLSESCIVENSEVKFTMSIAVVTVLPNDSAFKLIGRADKALFQAKILGKNRIQAEGSADSILQEWL